MVAPDHTQKINIGLKLSTVLMHCEFLNQHYYIYTAKT